MRVLLLMLSVFVIESTLANEKKSKIYRWKDTNGQWIYSDKPNKSAQEVAIKEPLKSPKPAIYIPKVNNNKVDNNYKVTISRPHNEQTIRDNNGVVNVSAQVTPKLKQGYQVQLLLNGVPTGPKQMSTSFTLKDVYRGAHTLSIKLYNSNNKVVSSSATTTFFVHRARVGK